MMLRTRRPCAKMTLMTSRWKTSTTQERLKAIDLHVGGRILQRRTLLGLEPDDLARALDVSPQMIQNYEQGTRRISIAKLYRLCFMLEAPMSFFFDGLPDEMPARNGAAALSSPSIPDDPARKREMLEFMRAFRQIPRASVRRLIVDLVMEMAKDQGPERTP